MSLNILGDDPEQNEILKGVVADVIEATVVLI